MKSTSDSASSRLRLLTCVEVILVATVPIIYWLCSREAISADPYVYGQVAKELLAGKRLYATTWQDKPPLAFVFYAVPQLFAPRSYAASVIWLSLCLVVQAMMFRWVFRSTRLGAFSCLAFILLFPMRSPDNIWPSTEHFSNLFIAANLLIAFFIFRGQKASNGLAIAAGALSCLGFHVRQTALFSGLLPVLGTLLAKQPAKSKATSIAVMAGAGLVCWGLVLGFVAAVGDLHGYFYTVFVYPRLYAAGGPPGSLPSLLSRMQESLPLLAALCLGLTAGKKYQWLAVAACVVGFFSCILPQRNFEHYWLNLMPYIALMVGVAMLESPAGQGKINVAVAAWLLAFGIFWTVMRLMAVSLHPTELAYERIANVTDRTAPPGATLLVVGAPPCQAIQFASKLPAANTYFFDVQFTPPWCDMLPRSLTEIFTEYEANPPGVIDIEKNLLAQVQAKPPLANLPNNLALVKLLMDQYSYRVSGEQDGFAICVRQ
jgi:hypothetical protein